MNKGMCNSSKHYCECCGETSLEPIGQFFRAGGVNEMVVLFTCYNQACEAFGKVVDINSNQVHIKALITNEAIL
jgi:hypothetical protein